MLCRRAQSGAAAADREMAPTSQWRSLSMPPTRGLSLLVLIALMLLVTVSAADLPRATPESVGVSSSRLARLDAALEAEIAAGRVPGIVVAVARRGRVVHQKAYGFANLQTREPMPADALFRLYSMTKPIASVALLTLYEQGLFRLTDPLDRYLPQFADLKVYKGVDASGQPVLAEPSRKPTIQDAFRHTLGLASGLGQSGRRAVPRGGSEHGPTGLAGSGDGRADDGTAALRSRRTVGVRPRPRRAGAAGRILFRHVVRRISAADDLRTAGHARHRVRRTAGIEAALRLARTGWRSGPAGRRS
jgi:CubicO group peptidase (beta-lactamase class C family)